MPRVPAAACAPSAAFLLGLPVIAWAGWFAGTWVYAQGFGSIPAWTLLMSSVSVGAGLFLGRFAVPFTLVFTLALSASLDHVARASPHNSDYNLWITVLVYAIGLFWVAVVFAVHHRKRMAEWFATFSRWVS